MVHEPIQLFEIRLHSTEYNIHGDPFKFLFYFILFRNCFWKIQFPFKILSRSKNCISQCFFLLFYCFTFVNDSIRFLFHIPNQNIIFFVVFWYIMIFWFWTSFSTEFIHLKFIYESSGRPTFWEYILVGYYSTFIKTTRNNVEKIFKKKLKYFK